MISNETFVLEDRSIISLLSFLSSSWSLGGWSFGWSSSLSWSLGWGSGLSWSLSWSSSLGTFSWGSGFSALCWGSSLSWSSWLNWSGNFLWFFSGFLGSFIRGFLLLKIFGEEFLIGDMRSLAFNHLSFLI